MLRDYTNRGACPKASLIGLPSMMEMLGLMLTNGFDFENSMLSR
jgi:hypothetical protein